MKLVLASKNQKKMKEMNDILSGMGVEVCLQADVGIDIDGEETGITFEENSRLKGELSEAKREIFKLQQKR